MTDGKFAVSGWDNDEENIDPSRNPKDKLECEILEAAENGNLERIKTLLTQNRKLVSAKDDDGYTPLHRACYGNHLEVVKYLVENGADVLAKTNKLWQPIHSCCHWGHYECLAFLIQHGADINAISEGGQTALHLAAIHDKSTKCTQLLAMQEYINGHFKNNSGDTPADLARRSSKYYSIFDLLDTTFDLRLPVKIQHSKEEKRTVAEETKK